jgi:tetratricopeptide (TPR) repeat protein
MAFSAIFFYVQKFFWPEHLSGLYDFYMATPIYRVKAVVAFIGLSVVTYSLWRKKDVLGFFFLLLFMLFLAPVLQIVPRANFVNDRYMYLPIIGWSGLVVLFAQSAIEKLKLDFKRTIQTVCVALLIPMSAISLQQARIWEHNLSFWEHTVQHNPLNILARNALGLEYHERRRYDEAIQQFDVVMQQQQIPMSLKLKAVNNLANVFTDTKYPGRSLEKAAQLYTVAIQSAERPNLTYELRINLAQTYYQMGRQQEALRMVNEVYKELKSDPDSRNIWLIPFIEKMLAGPPKG